MELYLIRHGKTEGNISRHYQGIIDEPLCEEGIRELKAVPPEVMPHIQKLYCSPMKRCIQTARILFPEHEPVIVSDLRERNFGKFEGKSYTELSKDPDYIAWINGSGIVPGGEDKEVFWDRCLSAVDQIVSDAFDEGIETAAAVCHGGIIMACMTRCLNRIKEFTEWKCGNGCGYSVTIDRGSWDPGRHFTSYRPFDI